MLSNFKKVIQRIFWPSIDRLPKIKIPILFITGTSDEIVPTEMTKALYDAATSSVHKQIHTVLNGMHNDTWFKGGKDYLYAIKDFMEKAKEVT